MLCPLPTATLPPEVGHLKKLESLTLNNNRLTSLPDTLCHLSALRDVNLAYNQLQQVPTQLGGLKALASVDLSHNRLAAVPPAIKSLHVIELNLNGNSVSSLDCYEVAVACVWDHGLNHLEHGNLQAFAISFSTLSESKQLYKIDSSENKVIMRTNSLRTIVSLWMNICQRSRVGVGMKRSPVGEVSISMHFISHH